MSTIKRRRADLGLHGARSKKVKLTENENEHVAVSSQLDRDLAKQQGVPTIKARIAHGQGVHDERLVLDNVVIQPKSPEKGKGVADSALDLSSGSPNARSCNTCKKLKVSYLVLDDDG